MEARVQGFHDPVAFRVIQVKLQSLQNGIDMQAKIIALFGFISLAACGASTPKYGVQNSEGISVASDATTLSLTKSGETTVYSLTDAELDGAFVAASNSVDPNNLREIWVSATDATAVALLVTKEADTGVVLGIETDLARLRAVSPLPTGSATAMGQYFGAIQSTPLDGAIRGDVRIDVNFDTAAISGEVTNRTLRLNGLPFDFILNYDIALLPTDLTNAGQFAGQTAAIGDVATGGEYQGLVGGTGGSEIVGQLTIGDEVGVFAVGHD